MLIFDAGAALTFFIFAPRALGRSLGQSMIWIGEILAKHVCRECVEYIK